MGSGKARPTNTRKGEKPWAPRGEPITEFGRWYRDNGLPVSRLTETISCSRGYAYELLNGTRVPSLENAVTIISWGSDGWRRDLYAKDFIPDTSA